MKDHNQEITAAVRKFLVDDDWKFDYDEDRGIFRFGVNMGGHVKSVRYYVDICSRDYVVYAVLPLCADKDDENQMREMAEFLCRANYGLRQGNFELDFRDGEIRYKCYVNCNEVMPGKQIIGSSIHCPSLMFMRYIPGIVKILFNGMSATDAIELCENDSDDDDDDDDDDETGGGSGGGGNPSSSLIDFLRGIRDSASGGSESGDDT